MVRLTLPLSVLLLPACWTDPPNEPEPPGRIVHEQALGLSFRLPPRWERTDDGGAVVYGGPRGDDTHYTTITLQAIRRTGDPLDSVLATLYTPAQSAHRFAWRHREPAIVAGHSAMRYGVVFELHETERTKEGVLLDAGPHLVDISYAAPADMFPQGVAAFEQLLATLDVY